MLWKCYNVTTNSSQLTLFGKLTQRWYNIVIPTSRRRSEFDVGLSVLYRYWHFNTRDMLWYEFTIQRSDNLGRKLWVWRRIVLSTLSKRFELYVIISTLQQRCSTPSVELIIKRWGRVRAALWFWYCGINVAITLCILHDVANLPQSCHKVVCLLGVHW